MNLFRTAKLYAATDCVSVAKSTITKCTNLLSQCMKERPSINTIKCLDDISNEICIAIDPLTACSRLHPDITLQNEANKAAKELQNFMNELNNDENIYNILNDIKSDKTLFESFSDEEQQITNCSLLEIKLSTSIHKTEQERDTINALRYDILMKEDEFYRLCHDIEENEMNINEGETQQKYTVNHHNFGVAMKNWKSETERKEMFELFYAHYGIRLKVLQSLREYRHSLAQQIGYTSFGALKAETSLFEGNIHKIQSYLTDLTALIESKCHNEAKELMEYNDHNGIKLWDLTFTKRLKYLNEKQDTETDVFIENIEHYLEIENCLQSLQRLMSICFNIEMDKCLSEDQYILKYELKEPITDRLIGVLYFDLFDRDNKASSECITFPLYCASKRIQQIPHVIVCMNIRKDNTKISLYQLNTLYHEFGHAMSYLLSNTEYQTLSGSRGLSMEYLEFPSTFFENFVFDKYFIKYIIMDNHMLDAKDFVPSQNVLSSIKNPFNTNLHLMQQITDSLLDLALFGDDDKQKESIQDIVYNTYKPLASIVSPSGIDEALYGYLLRASRFYHFIDYPANYYSYVIAEKISDSVWQKTFGSYQRIQNTGNNDRYLFEDWKKHMRYHGQRLCDEVFTFGSVKSPIECLNAFCDSQLDLV